MKRSLKYILAVLMLLLLLPVVFAQSSPNPGIGNVNFTVMNMDAAQSATVQADYVNQSGVVDSSISTTLDPRTSAGFPSTSSGLPDGWLGSAIVSADRQIVAFAQARWEAGTSADGKTAAAYNGFAGGATKLYFPSLAARSGKQRSELSIQSAAGASTSSTINITIKYYDRDGTLNTTVNDTILEGAQKTYDLLNVGLTPNRSDGWLGAATVESTSLIAGTSVMHWREYSAAYSGVTGGGTGAYLPSITRRKSAGGAWLQYTAVLVQNLDTSTQATVGVSWYDRNGVLLHNFQDTIPANSAHGYNTQFNADTPNPSALFSDLGTNFNGSVIVSSTVDIVAVSNLQWTASSSAGNSATAYSSEPSGYAEVFLPATFRVQTSGVWKQYSGLIVQNVGTATCTDFNVSWRDRSGVEMLAFTDSLDPGISHGYNSRYGGQVPSGADVNDLGTSFKGGVSISSSGCELIAIHNTLWPGWTASTTYNGFGQ
jgi:hypothetical protein